MEVMAGYKQTEIGIIPEDWDVVSIGDISKIFGRIGFRGYTVNDIVKEGKGAITISPSNIQDNKTDFSNCTYISWKKYEESPEIKIENGDILLVKTGSTVGKTALVWNLPELATINPQIVVLKKIKIDNVFLGYSMGFVVIQGQLKATTVGGALPTLSQKQVAQFKFPLPSTKAEQNAIAEALSDADALIEALEQLITKKRQVKQGAMQELLTGKSRLPGFRDEWKEKTIGSFAEVKTGPFGSALHERDYVSQGTPLITVEHLSENGLVHSNMSMVSDLDVQRLKAYTVQVNDIVFSRVGVVDRNSLIKRDEEGWLFSGSLLRLRIIKDEVHAPFISYFFYSEPFRNYVLSMAVGQTRLSLNTKIIAIHF